MRKVRWVTQPGDGDTVGEILARAGADSGALADGRVFVGRRRAHKDDERVRVGDVVDVAPAPSARPGGADLPVLARTTDLIAVAKPAGMPTIADHAGAAQALVPIVAKMLGLDAARVHATSRLDRDVSGVVILALTPEAASRLARARERGDYERHYLAIAIRAPEPNRGVWALPIGRARDPRLRTVSGLDPTNARTHFAACGGAPGGETMLAVWPVTGRTHQIRVHAAHAGAPLLGDRAYGGPLRLTVTGGRVVEPRRIALHAARVVVRFEGADRFVAVAPVPTALRELWAALGGDAAAWELCASCDRPSST